MNQPLSRAGNVSFRDEHPDMGDGREEIMTGLRQKQKRINPMWFYDQRGSELFDQITRIPEYYPTRTEKAILQSNRDAISARCGAACLFIEPGSGSSEKVRLLLDSLRPEAYVPIDISAKFLQQSARLLGEEYPWLPIHAVCADFNAGWAYLNDLPEAKRVVFYPGSTIGNLEPEAACRFLATLYDLVGPGGGVLIGVDTHKSTQRLNAAYNDAAGITAAFNLNILRRLNEMMGADFPVENFRHYAFYNEQARRIEMHLVSEGAQRVLCAGEVLEFSAGETIHTESSYKYTRDSFASLASSAGLHLDESWEDQQGLFGVHYLSRA